MSAAAATARVQSKSKTPRSPIPRITDEEREATLPALKGNFTGTENGYFDILPAKVSSRVEYVAIGQIIRRTYGGVGRPEFAPLPAVELAELTKTSTEGAEKALQDAVDHGFLDARKDGRKYVYRVVLSAFAVPEDKEPRKLERRPAQMELAPRPVFAACVYMQPGERSDPIALTPTISARYRNESTFPINVQAQEDEDGMLDIALTVEAESGEDSANHTPTRVRQSKGHLAENKSKRRDLREIGVMRDFLVRWCGREIGTPPTDQQISGILLAMNGHSRDRLAHKIQAWLPAEKHPSWAMVEDLARSLGEHAPERKSKPRTSGQESEPRANGKAHDTFAAFIEVGTKAGLPASEVDWDDARKIWNKLTLAEQLLAVQGIDKRIECGQYSDPTFRPGPCKYLGKKQWQHPLRPAKGMARSANNESPPKSRLDAALKRLAAVGSSR